MYTKAASSLLLTIAGLAWLANASHEPGAANPVNYLQHEQQHSTISSGSSRTPNELPNDAVRYEKLSSSSAHQARQSPLATTGATRQAQQSSADNAGTPLATEPGDSVEAMMDENYLELGANYVNNEPIVGNRIDALAPTHSLDETNTDKRNPFGLLKSSSNKTRRQMEQKIKTVDWWTKLVNDNKAKRAQAEAAKWAGGKQPAKAPKSVIYREQPLNQNALLTIRYQLMAIRDKHRMLMFKSVPQLMQLDQKLIDTYKLCLKRDMPLYAGMLYRTRDYVVRMANEIKHERQVLEAMAKQIQKVLRHKSTNSSLVRDYNRQLATLTSFSTLAPPSAAPSKASSSSDSEQVVQQHHSSSSSASSSSSSSSPHDDSDADYNKSNWASNDETSKRTQASSSSSKSSSSSSSSSSNELVNGNESTATFQRVFAHRGAATRDSDPNEELARDEKQVPLSQRQNIISNNIEQSTVAGSDDKSRLRFNKKSSRRLGLSSGDHRFGSQDGQQQTDDDEGLTPPSASKRQRQKFYTVNVNEVNLKRELTKAQALMDRINSSSHELMAVVDDIIYLFKLSSGDLNHRKSLAASGRTNKFDKLHGGYGLMDLSGMDNKKARKMMLKSPFKLFFERYGKLTMSSQAPSSSIPTSSDGGSSQMKSTTMSNSNMMTPSSFMDFNTNNAPEIKPLFDPASFAAYKDPVDLDLGFDAPATLDI